MDRRVVLQAVLVLHLVVAAVHGASHALVPVSLPWWADVLVLGTVFVGPLAGVVLVRRSHPLGVPLFTTAMAGALLLGVTLHFLVEGPDNVATIPVGPWRNHFRASAVGVAAVPAIGAAVGAWSWWRE